MLKVENVFFWEILTVIWAKKVMDMTACLGGLDRVRKMLMKMVLEFEDGFGLKNANT